MFLNGHTYKVLEMKKTKNDNEKLIKRDIWINLRKSLAV